MLYNIIFILFFISQGKSLASADNSYQDLNYSGYHKNLM